MNVTQTYFANLTHLFLSQVSEHDVCPATMLNLSYTSEQDCTLIYFINPMRKTSQVPSRQECLQTFKRHPFDIFISIKR